MAQNAADSYEDLARPPKERVTPHRSPEIFRDEEGEGFTFPKKGESFSSQKITKIILIVLTIVIVITTFIEFR